MRTAPFRPPVAIMGIPFDSLTQEDAIEQIERMVRSGRPHYVVTANVDFLVQARKDIELRRILVEADLVLCDGTPLVWASRLLGNALPERVAGADLVPRILSCAGVKGFSVFFLGASETACAKAVERVSQRFPDIRIAGYYSPPFGRLLEMDHDEIVARVRQAKPDLLFVSFGCPKQEKWIGMHYRALGVPVAIGVGATIDFLAEQVRRAPVWMQKTGSEWLFRLAQEPRRLAKRYARDLLEFGAGLAGDCLHNPATRNARPGPTPSFSLTQSALLIRLGSALDQPGINALQSFFEIAFRERRPVLLDGSQVVRLDATGVAFLCKTLRDLRNCGLELILVQPHRIFQKKLERLGLRELLLVCQDEEQAQMFINRNPRRFRWRAAREEHRPVFYWSGELTAVEAPEAWDQLVQEFERSQPTLIDLSELTFLDSSGLGILVRASKRGIRFRNPQAAVMNVLRLSGLEKILLAPATRPKSTNGSSPNQSLLSPSTCESESPPA